MRVCVTEKPSVARDIARLLGANDRHDGYYEAMAIRSHGLLDTCVNSRSPTTIPINGNGGVLVSCQ